MIDHQQCLSPLRPPDASQSSCFRRQSKGIVLTITSITFIGTSFILKKKGHKRSGTSDASVGVGGYGYLLEPLWWVGIITMIIGEIANSVDYIFSPTILLMPLDTLNITVSVVLLHFILRERLQRTGMLGCIICIIGPL